MRSFSQKQKNLFHNPDPRNRKNQMNNSTCRSKLRFKVGEVVAVNCATQIESAHFEKGIVLEVWPKSLPHPAAYLVQLCSSNTKCIACAFDTDPYIRPFDVATFLQLSPAIEQQVQYVGLLDTALSQAASVGDFHTIKRFACSTSSTADISAVDSKGRNILHIALISKQQQLVLQLQLNSGDPRYKYDKLLLAVDSEGRNVLHLAVLALDWATAEMCLVVPLTCTSFVNQAFVQRDNKGRIPLDYAVMFKKPDATLCLSDYTFISKVGLCKRDIERLAVKTDDCLLEVLTSHFSVNPMDLTNVYVSQSENVIMNKIMNDLTLGNHVKCVKWLVEGECCGIPTRLYGDSSKFIADQLHTTTCSSWPKEVFDMFPMSDHTARNYAFHQELYRLCDSWDCASQSFEEFLVSKQIPGSFDPATNRHQYDVPPISASHMASIISTGKGAEAIYQMWLQHSLDNIRVKHRVEVLDYLLTKADERLLTGYPIMFMLARGGHLAVLQWYVDRYWINLQVPLESDGVYWETAKNLKDAVFTTIQRGLTLCEFLCVTSVIAEQTVSQFVWLFEQCANPRFTVGGLNMLITAFTYQRYLVVRYLIEVGHFMVSDLLVDSVLIATSFTSHVALYAKKKLEAQSILYTELCAATPALAFAVPHGMTLSDAIRPDQSPSVPVVSDRIASVAMDLSAAAASIVVEASVYLSTDKSAVNLSPAAIIQRCFRRHMAQTKCKHHPEASHTNSTSFHDTWGAVICQLHKTEHQSVALSWTSIQHAHSMIVSSLGQFKFIDGLTSAAAKAVELPHVSVVVSCVVPCTVNVAAECCDHDDEIITSTQPSLENIELSSSALKWFEFADLSLREIFLKRVTQLADGQRSYALSKRLKHCSYPVYETKLDKGMRILWTKLQRVDKGSILVWFVAKHDDVCHFRDMIETSCSRQSTTLAIADGLANTDTALLLGEHDVLIDPAGNCPLKAYATSRTDITANREAFVRSWKPTMRLSCKQQQVSEESGTVLLLGRSGTGKTLCICDRMISDKTQSIGPIRQLFVCRSKRLCEFVRYYQQQYSDAARS